MSVHLRRVFTEQFVVLFLIIIKKHLLTNLFSSSDRFAENKIETMFILSDLYRVAINVGDRVLTPGMKQVS